MTNSLNKYGIIGSSLGHSYSPIIHNHFFRMNNLSNIYELFEVDEFQLSDIIKGLRTNELCGLNVTFPYKEVIIPLLDKLHKSAKTAGAVNTIQNINGILTGFNTDVYGIQSTLSNRLKINLKNKTVVLLGAGGAARACLTALVGHKPAKIIIFNRTLSRAEMIVSECKTVLGDIAIETRHLDEFNSHYSPEYCSVIISAMSAGAFFLETMLKKAHDDKAESVVLFDLNYGEKSLTQHSRQKFEIYEDGLYMLSAQAAESFRIWTDISLGPDEIYKYVYSNIVRNRSC
jgi:shikimate dehydrogenase